MSVLRSIVATTHLLSLLLAVILSWLGLLLEILIILLLVLLPTSTVLLTWLLLRLVIASLGSLIKEASTNFDLITEIRTKLSAQDFSIYSGDDSLTLPMLNIGANGVISVASHLVGTEIKEMMIYFNKYQIAEAQKIHNKLFPLFTALFTEPNPTCIKEALGIMNMCSNKLRAPLVNLSLEQKEDLKKVLQNTIKATI